MKTKKYSRARFRDWRWWAATISSSSYLLLMSAGISLYLVNHAGDCLTLMQVLIGGVVGFVLLIVGVVLMGFQHAADKKYEEPQG